MAAGATMPIFQQHYTVPEANALLPQLRQWLAHLQEVDRRYSASRERVHEGLEKRLYDAGGRDLAAHYGLWVQWRRCAETILAAGVQIKDLDRGLVDFPHLLPDTGDEVFLCWELSEPAVRYWHSIDAGYAERRPIADD
jgi:hypothetical protein